jgi:alanine dehydrogenase
MPLIIDNADVARLISPLDVIETLDRAYRAHAAGQDVSAPRLDFQSPENAKGEAYQLGLSVGLGSTGYGCIRIKSDMVFQTMVGGQRRKQKYCVQPGTYMGLLMVFDTGSGALRAIIHDGVIQRMRVGADSALGVRYMARPDARTLGILGAGGMAETHLDAIAAVRSLQRVRIYSPTAANREALAARARERHGFDIEAVETPDAIFEGADIVASCTNAIGPVVPGALLAAGMHVTCIGGTLDAQADARIDRALRFGTAGGPAEAPEMAVEDECLTYTSGAEKSGHGGTRRFHNIARARRIMFADLLANPSCGRSGPEQITFSERGNIHGVQFAALVGMIFERARDAGLGRQIDDGLFLQSIRN